MKKTIYIFLLPVIFVVGCAEDFLDQKNLYEKSDESYFFTPEDVDEALTGAYAALPNDNATFNPIFIAKLMSDDAFGGGGSDNATSFHTTDAFILPEPDFFNETFEINWPGILRTNLILKRFEQVEYSENEINRKNQALGETHFLRAYFYFRLSKFFGPVPLKLEPVPENKPRATPEEMYGQIAFDLKKAIETMPSTPYSEIPTSRLGHATKWAAEALLARVYLFYSGYYNQTDIELPDGTTLTKNEVTNYLVDCIENSGHDLLDDFRNIWPYSYVQDYPFTNNNGLEWADEEGANVETIFAIKYSIYGGWSEPNKLSFSNQHVLYTGLRGQAYVPFGTGWGGGPVNPQLWESFEEGDLRREGSILNVNISDPNEGTIAQNFIWGSNTQYHETGYWDKKYMPIYDSADVSGGLASIFYIRNGGEWDIQLRNMQDDILIRFADVLLMAAELGAPDAQSYFDKVRNRAGLDSKPVSLENIKIERRHELAFEGLRYFDLLRWGDAKNAIEAANGLIVKNEGLDAEYNVTFPEETGGFLPIPQTEITLSGGVLEQTPGW